MSKVESQNNDAKKLALRCKTLEAQLRQSIPKKEHNEMVSKLEREVTGLEKELDRAKSELQKTVSINKQVGMLGDQISAQSKVITGQGRTLDSLLTKISQGTVPLSVHQQSLSRIREFENQIQGMVSKGEFASLERRCEELSQQMTSMVPATEHASLKQRFEELERAASSLVPREQLASSDARVRELEARLEQQVPQTTYDELVSKIVSLAEEVTGGSSLPEGAESASQGEAEELEPVTTVDPVSGEPAETPTQQQTVPIAGLAASSETATRSSDTVPEIREIQSQLSEISSRANEAAQVNANPARPSGVAQFRFSNTEIIVATGAEFAQAIPKVPTPILELHVRNGDLEKWFLEALSDGSTAEAFRKIREIGSSGERLRSQVTWSVAKYRPRVEPTIRSTPGTP